MENLANIYPFLSQVEHRYFLLKNTEFLNVSWALILLNLLTQKSLNSNKLLLVLYFTNYYNGETFMTKIFGTKFLSFKFDIENEIFHLFEEKEGLHTDSLSSNNYSINLFFLHIFPERIILICMSLPNIYIIF